MRKFFGIALPLGFLLLLTLIFFHPLLSGQMYAAKGFIQADLLGLNFPFRYFFGQWLKQGVFPFWDPLNVHSYPLFAEGETGMLYPIHIICYLLLPPVLAFNTDLIIHVFLAGCFTYLLCRKIWSLNIPASLLGAVVFSFGGPAIVHILQTNGINTITWLPLELYALEKILQRPALRYFYLLVFTLVMGFLAGFVEIYFYFQLVFGLYLLAKTFLAQKKDLGKTMLPVVMFLLAGLATAGLAMPQISATAELVGQSTRATGVSERGSRDIIKIGKHLLSFVAPQKFNFFTDYDNKIDYDVQLNYSYLGILTLGFISAGAWLGFRRNNRIINYTISAVALFLISANSVLPFFNTLYTVIPFMNMFRMPRFYVLTSLFLAIIAAWGFQQVTASLNKKYLTLISFTVIIVIFADLLINNGSKLGPSNPEDWFSLPKTAALIKPNLGLYRTFGNSPQFFNFTDDLKVQQQIKEFIPHNFNIVWGISNQGISTGLYLERDPYFGKLRFVSSGQDTLSVPENYLKLMSLEGIKYIIREKQIINPKLKLLAEIPLNPPVGFKQQVGSQESKLTISKIYLHENLQVMPRAFSVIQTEVVPTQTGEEVFSRLNADNFDPSKTVILEVQPHATPAVKGKKPETNINITSYTPNRVTIETKTNRDSYLLLTDYFYPGWKATIDRAETPIYRADLAFRAVYLPQGNHTVEFTFEPTYWRKSWYVSMTTMGILIIISLFKILVLRKKKANSKLQISNSK